MILTVDTNKELPIIRFTDDQVIESDFVNNLFYNLIMNPLCKTQDVIVEISKSEFELDFSDSELTRLASESSISSFDELWKDEDDDYWNSYL